MHTGPHCSGGPGGGSAAADAVNTPARSDEAATEDEMTQSVICLDTNKTEWEQVLRGRVNSIRRKRLPLDSGVPGVTLECSYVLVPDGYFTPRHHHNFDQ